MVPSYSRRPGLRTLASALSSGEKTRGKSMGVGVGDRRGRVRLFLMMVLQTAIWGAWAPKLFPYMTMLHFSADEQAAVGSSWGIAAIVGIFFSNQFADRNFAAERFLAGSHAAS